MSCPSFQPVVYLFEGIGSVRLHPLHCTGTHNPSLLTIPTAQKQSFAGIALLLVMYVMPGLSREDSCDIRVSHRTMKDVQGYKGIIARVNLARITVPLWTLSNLSILRRLDSYTIPSTTAMTEIYHKDSNRIAL
jgi:hypothetical protein